MRIALASGVTVHSNTNKPAAPQAALKVHSVGKFVASFVPSQSDFDRLDPQFVIPKESWAKLPEYQDFGFAVFQLKELSGYPSGLRDGACLLLLRYVSIAFDWTAYARYTISQLGIRLTGDSMPLH